MNLSFTPPQLFLPGLHVGLEHYLILAALLFAMGLFAVMTRRHAVAVLLGLELMLNAANINLVAFNHFQQPQLGGAPLVSGQVFALMVIALAACEAAVGLALILSLYRNVGSATPDEVDQMKG
ncbi:MAG TPA: NADH-quinone oxidoreductase subunit NuoK [Armatimonadota bacterium]|jgi:NADH:ubiquinone oxidoreductase subunit K